MQSLSQYINEITSLPAITLVGALLVAINMGFYSIVEASIPTLSAESSVFLDALAYLYFSVLIAAVLLSAFGLYKVLKQRILAVKKAEEIPYNIGSIIPYIFTEKGVVKIFIIAVILYGMFYSFVTSMIVYMPDVKFSEVYNAIIPSVIISPCCGPPGQIPVLVGYLTENIGFLILPLTLLTLVIVSGLVALNVSLTYYAWKNRPSISKQNWSAGLGAAIGLFTGCPTCAGLFLANIVGGAGATTLALSLAPFQFLIIAITIPVLLITPYMVLGNIAKALGGSCIRISKERNKALPN
ncbi:MAG: hypothetical protein HYY67_04505 [Thaumarchaeota archaeon]|nr:hypothetical protein [Nitrososphaerota archaeon]